MTEVEFPCMNPDLYTALPPDKKEEYKKLFPTPAIYYFMWPMFHIDDLVPPGYVLFGEELTKLSEAMGRIKKFKEQGIFEAL